MSSGVIVIGVEGADRVRYTLSLGRAFEAATSGGFNIAMYEDYHVTGLPRGSAAMRVAHRYRVIQSERELLAYHWNPAGPEGKPYPHLHLSAAAEVGNRALTRAHIPTGEVRLHDVVRLLIEELGVRPRRPDWRSVLGETVP